MSALDIFMGSLLSSWLKRFLSLSFLYDPLFVGEMRLMMLWHHLDDVRPLDGAAAPAAAIFSSSGASTAQLDRFALIVPDELLHFLANVSQSAIGKERNEGKSLPPWRCHFHTLGLAACQQTGQSKEVEWTLGLRERRSSRG
ncbi:hypothetical protein GBF38_019806 [Nibea albiflora]|uniref:Uncharacterized protein n=1 Tax=Nibea albiflora TaxID=240163 RepID=A0ACB7F6C5_NIBAL|nr:hypothetical protein GBF38_019806 [Nibea albiflora]